MKAAKTLQVATVFTTFLCMREVQIIGNTFQKNFSQSLQKLAGQKRLVSVVPWIPGNFPRCPCGVGAYGTQISANVVVSVSRLIFCTICTVCNGQFVHEYA